MGDKVEFLNRDEMKEIMLYALRNQTSYSAYLKMGLDQKTAVEHILGNDSPSLDWKGIFVNVDFAVAAGSAVGSPTNNKDITVSYRTGDMKMYERFKISELINLCGNEVEQMDLFEFI